MSSVPRRTLAERMKGAAVLDAATYEEVEHDSTATGQAAGVVAMVAVAQAIGATGLGIGAMVGGVVSALVGWLAWAGITYLVGDKLFGGTATWGELLRTIGFAQAPGILLVLAFIPLVGWMIRAVVGVWVLIAGFVAIRAALDVGFGKTLLTVLVGWVAMMLLSAIFLI